MSPFPNFICKFLQGAETAAAAACWSFWHDLHRAATMDGVISQPLWRRDGRELFFVGADGALMAVVVGTSGGFETGTPQALFQDIRTNVGGRQYAPTRDGQRFLLNKSSRRSNSLPITVTVNWLDELRTRKPATQ